MSELNTDVDYTDPQLSYYAPSWELEYATACKLMNYPDKEAPAGGQVLPEVAAGLPVVSKDGKTYTFTIRPGFKFSNGEAVTALSFKRAIERLADPKMASTAFRFRRRHHRGCPGSHRRQGVERLWRDRGGEQADDQADPSRPGPARPSGDAVLPGDRHEAGRERIDPQGVDTYASCGPYYFAARTPNRSITLKRNTFYKGSRPHNADTIQVNIGNSPDVIYQNVVKGTTDYAADGVPPSLIAGIAKKYGVNKKQFFTRPQLEVDYLALNHDRALFKNNPQLAKAANWAIDRQAYTAQRGVRGCPDQPDPPAGHGRCDQEDPGDGGTAIRSRAAPPQTSRRRRRSRPATRGRQDRDVGAERRRRRSLQAQIVQFDLKQIGLDVSIKLLPRAQQFVTARNRSQATYDINWSAWGADYNDPYDFINILLDGTTIGPTGEQQRRLLQQREVQRADAQGVAHCSRSQQERRRTHALDKTMMSEDPPWAPMLNRINRLFVSSHVGCFTYNPVFEVDYAAALQEVAD